MMYFHSTVNNGLASIEASVARMELVESGIIGATNFPHFAMLHAGYCFLAEASVARMELVESGMIGATNFPHFAMLHAGYRYR